ncbi:MAG: hypothetical protein AAF337_04990 [Pseudomonadota bacterium]
MTRSNRNASSKTLSMLILLILALSPASAQAQQTSSASGLPASLIGTYLVYDSGSVTSFRQQKTFIFTQTFEYYIYSRSQRTGTLARVSYNRESATIRVQDIMTAAERKDLIAKNSIYKRCSGALYKPAVHYKVTPLRQRQSGSVYSDRWAVQQKTKVCDIINVRHHSKDNSCETSCVKWIDEPLDTLKYMRLFASKQAALENSKKRPY